MRATTVKAARRWGQRLVGLGFAALLGACELIVSSDLGEVGCPKVNHGFIGPPACPVEQICLDAKCVPCPGGHCSSASGGAGGGASSASDPGGSGGASGAGGPPGSSANPAAGQAGSAGKSLTPW
jgi:hypothetical protein